MDKYYSVYRAGSEIKWLECKDAKPVTLDGHEFFITTKVKTKYQKGKGKHYTEYYLICAKTGRLAGFGYTEEQCKKPVQKVLHKMNELIEEGIKEAGLSPRYAVCNV
jgi:hypothetical protein